LAAGYYERMVTMKNSAKTVVKMAFAVLLTVGLTLLATGCPPIKM